jgi:hypothetical protein
VFGFSHDRDRNSSAGHHGHRYVHRVAPTGEIAMLGAAQLDVPDDRDFTGRLLLPNGL